MSEANVVDPVADGVDKEEKWPPCFGEYDAKYEDCTKICLMRVQCERHTNQAPKPAPPAPELDPINEVPDMSAHEFLVSSLNGRFEVDEVVKGSMTIYNCRKDGNPVGQVRKTESGKYLFRTRNATLEISSLDETKQVHYIVQALLSV
jgi:hypothetical protein